MSDRAWTITAHEGGAKVFETTIPVDVIAESDLKALLQRLAARGLSEEEVIAASLSSEQRTPRLEIGETSEGGFGFTTDPAAARVYLAILGEAG